MRLYRIILCLLTLIILVFLVPVNKIFYIKDKEGVTRLSRIERSSILFHVGTFFSPGKFDSYLFRPESFVKPNYVRAHPFDEGCFNLVVEFGEDKVIVYMGTKAIGQNLTDDFQLASLPNAFGEKNWFSVHEDTTGTYLPLDCKTGIE